MISHIPFDVKAEFGKARHILGIRKDIRAGISKQPGDTVRVTLCERKKVPSGITTVSILETDTL